MPNPPGLSLRQALLVLYPASDDAAGRQQQQWEPKATPETAALPRSLPADGCGGAHIDSERPEPAAIVRGQVCCVDGDEHATGPKQGMQELVCAFCGDM